MSFLGPTPHGDAMSDVELVAAIRGIVLKHSRIRLAQISEGHTLARDLGFDSLAFLLTLSDLEDRLRFPFPLERVDELRDISFGDLVRLVSDERTRARGIAAETLGAS